MIVVYGPWPAPRLVKEGWMRRIHAVDRIFSDRERHYVFFADPARDRRGDYRVATAQVGERVWSSTLDPRLSLHWRHLTALVERCDLVYAHTAHSAAFLLPYYRTGKVVTDVHGLAPEEEAMQGRPEQSAFFGGLEATMVRESAALVTVTRAMTEHFRGKYPGLRTPTIELPVVDDRPAGPLRARPARARLRVVYAGGLQPWQNAERMLDAVARTHGRHDFVFYTDAVARLRALARRRGVGACVDIRFCPPERLPAALREADLGFVLRDDCAVNRVSCPTKLSEYLMHGVVPVVQLAEIGDFARLGYRFVRLDDFLANEGLDAAALQRMRAHNRGVVERIVQTHERGREALRTLGPLPPRLEMRAQRGLFLTPSERAAVFPAHASLRVRRGGVEHEIELADIAFARGEYAFALPGSGPLESLRYRPLDRPCVTTPIVAEVVTEGGASVSVALRGTWTADALRNWIFDGDAACAEAVGLGIAAPVSVVFRFELLLCGAEVAFARPSWRRRLLRWAWRRAQRAQRAR